MNWQEEQLIAAIQDFISARGGVLHTQQVPEMIKAVLPPPEEDQDSTGGSGGNGDEEIVADSDPKPADTPPADTPVPPAPAPEGDAAL